MRPGRCVVVLALPLLALLGAGASAAPLALPAVPVLSPLRPVLVRADGFPERVLLPARHRPPAARPVVRTRPPAHRALRPVPRPASAPASVPLAPLPAPVVADGYPWASDGTGGNDPWGFTKRQCVSYAAWRLAGAGHPVDNAQGWGSATDWDAAAARLGWTVTGTPQVGAVAQWDAGESSAYWAGSTAGSFRAGPYGHVAWVTAVRPDGSVDVAQYNGDGTRTFSSAHLRAPRYLLPPGA